MKEGDRVILQQALGPCEPGAEGIVDSIDSEGMVVVNITHDHQCNPCTALLPPVPRSYYVEGSKCTE